MLWPAIPIGLAIEGINHQRRAGRCGKECTARVHVQAASDRYEQKHKQTENQFLTLLCIAIHSFRSAMSGFPRRTTGPLSSAVA
jgi:zinc transporter ZupT